MMKSGLSKESLKRIAQELGGSDLSEKDETSQVADDLSAIIERILQSGETGMSVRQLISTLSVARDLLNMPKYKEYGIVEGVRRIAQGYKEVDAQNFRDSYAPYRLLEVLRQFMDEGKIFGELWDALTPQQQMNSLLEIIKVNHFPIFVDENGEVMPNM